MLFKIGRPILDVKQDQKVSDNDASLKTNAKKADKKLEEKKL